MRAEHHQMLDELSPPADEPTVPVEFIGFENTPAAASTSDVSASGEFASAEGDIAPPELPVPVKPKPRRAAKSRKGTYFVRVVLDEDEFRKLNMQADAEGLALPEFVRRRALLDPRTRSRQVEPSADDLFVRNTVVEASVVRLAPLSPDLEHRISAYFSPEVGCGRDPLSEPARQTLFSKRPRLLARLGQLVTELVTMRWLGHRAAPPARM
jgi:hypothetical protein